jgi:diguanylate cyclase (GGDEF)-like protein
VPNSKNHYLLINLLSIALVIFILFISIAYTFLDKRTQSLKNEKYQDLLATYQKETSDLIQAKKEATLQLALALATNADVKSALLYDDPSILELKAFTAMLRHHTPFQNVWFQIIDKQGYSFYRSWTKKRKDYLLNARMDISEAMQNTTPMTTISTGKFDMTFKSMVPIFYEEELIGIFEVLTHFNSIAIKLRDNGGEPVILVDKRYKKQLKFPFTKRFVKEYYVANLDVNSSYLDYLNEHDIEKLIGIPEGFMVDVAQSKLILIHTLNDIAEEPMGYFIYFLPLENIDVSQIEKEKNSLLFILSASYLFIVMVLLFFYLRRSRQNVLKFNKALADQVSIKTYELNEQKLFLQEVIDGVSESLMVISKDYTILLMNAKARENYSELYVGDAKYPKCYEVSHQRAEPCDSKQHPCPLNECVENKISSRVIHNHEKNDGSAHFIEITSTPLFDDHGEVKAVIEIGHDITTHLKTQGLLKDQKLQLEHLAHHDTLTGLPNRLLFLDRLEHAIEKAKRSDFEIAVLFLDLDHFKQINDSLGHYAGDYLLKTIATRLSQKVRKVDTVARLGGDEFTILLEGCPSENDLIDIIEKINQEVSKVIIYKEHKLYSSVSIGMSIYPNDGEDVETLLKNADTAMYRAKDSGRNGYEFYEHEMGKRAVERVMLESAIRTGLENDEFFLEYQPQFDSRTDRIIGMEALVRWNHPTKGRVSPIDFIALAEESGLIIELGEKIFYMAAKQAHEWHEEGFEFGRIAVNLSIKQLKEKSLIDKITNILQETQCRAECLEIEVTESFIMENPDEAVARLKEIRDQGFVLSMDDFGTGYSSLSLLKKLPIYKLKIDQSFIRDIADDEDDKIITRTIIDLAKNMHLEVIAEGVEEVSQKEFLSVEGCFNIQGYLYSRPLDVEAMRALLSAGGFKSHRI